MNIKQLQTIATIVCISIATISNSQTISFAPFSSGYDNPVAIAHANDSRLFVVEKTGAIFICDSVGVRNPIAFLNISNLVSTTNSIERGLLGMVFHPNYASNGYFYVNYTDTSGNTRIDRFTRDLVDINLADSSTRFNILTIMQPTPNHNGGTLKFGPDGYLYIGMGDGGDVAMAQAPLSLLGKMLRIDVNNASPYSIPPTNPYVGNVNYAPEIWAMGLRNPWKFSFDRITGDLWIADVGDNVEEINFRLAGMAPGENYAWPCHQGLNTSYTTTGLCTTPLTGNVVAPIFDYPYVITAPATSVHCAVIGGYRYRSAKHNSLFGTYFFTDWCSALLRTVTGTPGNWTVSNNINTGHQYVMVSFAEDRNGDLYGVMGGWVGQIHKLNVSNSCAPVAYIFGNDTVALPVTLQALSYPGLQYQWQLDGNNVIGANQSTYAPITAGLYTIVVTQPSGSCSTTSTQVLVQNLNPTVVTNNPAAVCSPATVDLTLPAVTAGSTVGLVYTYFTDAEATLPYPDSTTAVAGAYYIVGTTGLGYSDTTSVTVTINPIPTVLATNPAAVCSPATIDLTLAGVTVGSTPGLTFTYFTDPAATISYPSPTTAITGTYYIVGTTGGCSDTTSVTVTINPTPTITQNGSELTSSAISGNQWYWDGSVIIGATNQTYTITQNGNYTVIANSNACSSVTVNITSTSIQLSNNTVTLSVYPNPSDGNFTVSFYAPTKSIYRVEVRSILGALVFKDVLANYSGNYSKSFNVLEYGKGVYTISLISANSETLKEIVVY